MCHYREDDYDDHDYDDASRRAASSRVHKAQNKTDKEISPSSTCVMWQKTLFKVLPSRGVASMWNNICKEGRVYRRQIADLSGGTRALALFLPGESERGGGGERGATFTRLLSTLRVKAMIPRSSCNIFVQRNSYFVTRELRVSSLNATLAKTWSAS